MQFTTSAPLRSVKNPQETAKLEYENYTLTTSKPTDKSTTVILTMIQGITNKYTKTIKSKIKQLKDLAYCQCPDKLIQKLGL